jgi:hypothetical protein
MYAGHTAAVSNPEIDRIRLSIWRVTVTEIDYHAGHDVGAPKAVLHHSISLGTS